MTEQPRPTQADPDSSTPTDALPSPRGQALWTGIYAVAMLYFGWYVLKDPGQGMISLIMAYVLRYGGAAMVIAALFLATNSAASFLVDGLLGILVGIGMAIVGALILTQEELGSGAVCLVFGYLFFTSGRRSLRDYGLLTGHEQSPDTSSEQDASPD